MCELQMRISVNGIQKDIEESTSLEGVLKDFGHTSPKGVAAAVNNQVVPRARWKLVTLKPLDKIIIITASQGG
jgi:sulfur carrier protein